MQDQLTQEDVDIIKQGAADRYAERGVDTKVANVLFAQEADKLTGEANDCGAAPAKQTSQPSKKASALANVLRTSIQKSAKTCTSKPKPTKKPSEKVLKVAEALRANIKSKA